MNDNNLISLDLHKYLISNNPELMKHVDESIALNQEVGACLEWKYNFEKYITDDIDILKEYSVMFLLAFYKKDLLCHKVISKDNIIVVYMFFKDSDGAENCLKRLTFFSYHTEIEEDYKLFLSERNIFIEGLDFNEPQELLGTSKRNIWVTIIHLLISFPIFLLIDSAPIQAIFFIGVISFFTIGVLVFLPLWGTTFREKHK